MPQTGHLTSPESQCLPWDTGCEYLAREALTRRIRSCAASQTSWEISGSWWLSAMIHSDSSLRSPPVPADLPDVKRVFQYVGDALRIENLSGLGSKALFIQVTDDIVLIPAGREHGKDGPHNGSLILIDFRNFSGALLVAQGKLGIIHALLGPQAHTPAYLHAQIVGIELILPLNDHFDEAAVHAVHDRLTDRDNVDAQLLPQHGLVEGTLVLVPGEAAELPDQDAVEGLGLRLGHGDHVLELEPVPGFPAGAALLFHENELGRDNHIVGSGVAFNLHQLRFRGLFHLHIRADPDIDGPGADFLGICGHGILLL